MKFRIMCMETEETGHIESNIRTVRCSNIILKGLTFLDRSVGCGNQKNIQFLEEYSLKDPIKSCKMLYFKNF